MGINKATNLIKLSSKIGIMGHIHGDGDCYGSMFGLGSALDQLGKKVTLFSGEDFPESLTFLFYFFTGQIESLPKGDLDLLIIMDVSSISRLSSIEIYKHYVGMGTKILLIDHHQPGDIYDTDAVKYVDSQSSSTSELTFSLLRELGVNINKNISTSLLAGIVFDTSSFQNQNTTEASFAIASELMKDGARLKVINDNLLGGRDVDALKVWGLAMERLYVNQKYGIVSTFLSYDDIAKYGLSVDALSGIINYLNSIKDVRLIVLITEPERGDIKVSFRSRDDYVNVARLAMAFGGGGHIKAAAFKIQGTLVVSGNTASIV